MPRFFEVLFGYVATGISFTNLELCLCASLFGGQTNHRTASKQNWGTMQPLA